MNKFVAKRSNLFLLLAWFIAVAFFNDQANLTDIFPDTATLHFDEGNGSDAVAQFNAVNSISSTSGAFGQHAGNKACYHQQSNASVKNVILDEDSPSIPAASFQTEYAAFFLAEEETACYHSYNPSSSLYLQNCTLLI